MEQITDKKFSIASHKTSRTFLLACEVEKSFGIDRKIIFGLCGRKTVEEIDRIFREVLKAKAISPKALFMFLVSKLPNKRVKKQVRLKLKHAKRSL